MKKIGLTFGDTNFENYPTWIKGNDADIEVVILSYKYNNIEDAKK
jgi:putative glutamine amidotransferase